MLNNIILLRIILVILVIYSLTIYIVESFSSQENADKFYEPDLCGPQFCNLGNWDIPFQTKLDNKYKEYSMVGSCKNGCRARKLKLNINKSIL